MGRQNTTQEENGGGRKMPPSDMQRKDDQVTAIIHNLDLLIAHAGGAGLGTAARILSDAKEELVHWAVTLDFHESPQDAFVNRHLCDSGLVVLGAFLTRLEGMANPALKEEMAKLLGTSLIEACGSACGAEDGAEG
jgi:hypothetical protein